MHDVGTRTGIKHAQHEPESRASDIIKSLQEKSSSLFLGFAVPTTVSIGHKARDREASISINIASSNIIRAAGRRGVIREGSSAGRLAGECGTAVGLSLALVNWEFDSEKVLGFCAYLKSYYNYCN